MNLVDRKRFKGESTECVMCGNEREDMQHFILHCPAYQEERRRHPGLQRPYQEEEDQVIGSILFENENTNIENTKEAITKFWHQREKKRTSTEKPRPRPPLYICIYERWRHTVSKFRRSVSMKITIEDRK